MINKELKMKLGQLQVKMSEASQTVSGNLSNDFKIIILENAFHEVNFRGAAKISTISYQ